MKVRIFSFLYLLMIVVVSCAKKENTLAFEEEVFYEIFPLIDDEIKFDYRDKKRPPLPPKPGEVGLKFDTKKSEYANDNRIYVVAIEDSLMYPYESYFEDGLRFFENSKVELDDSFKKIELQIDLERLKSNSSRVKFKYFSEYPQDSRLWRQEYEPKLASVISFSKIIFDKSKTYGFFSLGCYRGRLNGATYNVYIKKSNGKWVIIDLKMMTIS